MWTNKSYEKPILDLKSSTLGATVLLKLLFLSIVPIIVWIFTEDKVITMIAVGLVLFAFIGDFFAERARYKVYQDRLEFKAGQAFTLSLKRINQIKFQHLFYQPVNVGNIVITVGSARVFEPTLTARIMGAKPEQVYDTCPVKKVVLKNIKDYRKIIEDITIIADKACLEQKQKDKGLTGISNPDDLLPWGLKNATKNTNKNKNGI